MSSIPLGDIPALHARRLGPERWCVRYGESSLTWGELDARSTRRAWALKAKGVGLEDIVMLGLPNCSELYELTFAIWKLGATPSVISWRLPLREFRAIVDVAKPKLLFASDAELIAATGALGPDFGLSNGDDRPIASLVSRYWKAMTSGGSTGRPKMIVDHTPAVFDPAAERLFMPSDRTVLNPGPCYHNAPFASSHMALFKGNALVGLPKFDAEESLRLIEKYKVEWVTFVPTMMNRIWRLPPSVRNKYDLTSLKYAWHMASPMPPWLKENWIAWLGPERVWELYGGTERQGMTLISGTEWLAHKGSVGKPFGCQIRILSESGESLPSGEVGEIYMRADSGQGSTYHYLGAESRGTTDGFESIGDFGWVDEDGYLFIADRRTDMILSGGANIYPAEIESALMEHEAVQDAVVVGLPDDDMGALSHAIIKLRVPSPHVTADAMRDFLSERLVRYKVPRTFEFTDEPLRDDAGKVRRSQLREERIAHIKATTTKG